ncbi:hypothetical protein L1987_46414 [Smallanthus sonchifolius]|uniref:Uncharacterized protein n=1 Tax=Smallanthus sonchifolius TaxID=185202 RepID=A0ACB9G0P3_9ASTR|nr:hypothetical protein L1987_46414 [Smallanthus sonchifolius]
MDGAPYLRKVDLRAFSVYQELSSALEKMFCCFTIGQYGSHGNEKLSETKLKDLLHGSEYVLTYEDKDGDWMLVGDVPWEMFIGTCKRLRIMRSCDAIGLCFGSNRFTLVKLSDSVLLERADMNGRASIIELHYQNNCLPSTVIMEGVMSSHVPFTT